MFASRSLTLAALAVAGIVALPLLAVLSYVLRDSGGVWSHLASTMLPLYLLNSALLVAGVGTLVILLGVSTAWLVTAYRFPGRALFAWCLILPLACPAYITAYVYTDLLEFSGPVQTLLRTVTGWEAREYWFPNIRSLGGAVFVMGFVLYPYVYLMARTAFLEQSVCAAEVSRTLGCTPWQSFLRVSLPMARPGIAAGTTLALMETLADFGTVDFFAVPTFTTGIYRTWFGFGSLTAAAQLSACLLVIVAILVACERWSRRLQRYYQTSTRTQPIPRRTLPIGGGLAAASVCAIPVIVGFVVPAGVLVSYAIETGDPLFGGRFTGFALNSLKLGLVTAIAAVSLSVVLAYAKRLHPTRAVRSANQVASLGYAVPGSVIAVGIVLPFAAFDNALDGLMRHWTGLSTGLVLTGTIAALVIAYLVRFLAVSLNAVDASLTRVSPNMDAAARLLGRGPFGALVHVHLPIIRGGLLTAGLLVFVDVLKELPATLILRPFNFDTLAIRVYRLASDERLAEASTAALAIVLVGVVPVILLSRAAARGRPGDATTRTESVVDGTDRQPATR